MKKIVFPEGDNELVRQAADELSARRICEPVLLDGSEESLQQAVEMVRDGAVEACVAGIDLPSRAVILPARDIVGMTGKTFSSLMLMEFPDGRKVILSDAATCKNPTAQQLADISILASDAAAKIFGSAKTALLSFSTFGSGGHDDSIDKIRETIKLVRAARPNLIIDGEMQLDAAVNQRIGHKKAPDSEVAGEANVLICPDINSANILYKSFEQFAGAKAYGPILLGFKKPISDLSRGSTSEDIVGTAETLLKLI
ncbi:MAG: phosphate acetyltransferase [Candidatus Nomurabacteria bacterium]|jgi:phosphotransacetylase|nr:phosphate acetyltransferase [Candidatus Nomurabacteria bacterium]